MRHRILCTSKTILGRLTIGSTLTANKGLSIHTSVAACALIHCRYSQVCAKTLYFDERRTHSRTDKIPSSKADELSPQYPQPHTTHTNITDYGPHFDGSEEQELFYHTKARYDYSGTPSLIPVSSRSTESSSDSTLFEIG